MFNLFGGHSNGLCLLIFLVLVALIVLTTGFLIECMKEQPPQISMADIKLTAYDLHVVTATGTTAHEKLTISNEGESAFSWQMTWDATWLNVQPVTGTITPSISETIQIDFDAMALSPGTYNTMLSLTGNEDEYKMPITLEVIWHETYLPLVIDEEPRQ